MIKKLNLWNPPPPSGRPRLWVVPRGPAYPFSIPRDEPIPWPRRLLWGSLAAAITVAVVVGILLFAALVKQLYDTAGAAPEKDGKIPVRLSDRPPPAPAPAP